MTSELLGPETLLDRALVATFGPVDPPVVEAIVDICNDAIAEVLGPSIMEILRADGRLIPLVAPWVADLARGLLMSSLRGPGQLSTSELLRLFGGTRLAECDIARCAQVIDLSTVLTLDRVLDHVLGEGAGAKDPSANDAAVQWLSPLQYGHRVHLTLELVRLLPTR